MDEEGHRQALEQWRASRRLLDPVRDIRLWTDGVILFGEASLLTGRHPGGLAPWFVVRFSLRGTPPKERVRLARRLHGVGSRPGIIHLPGLNLARGAALVPAEQARAVQSALDNAGAVYDMIPVWREV